MAAEGMQFPWRWNGGTISTNLEGIWAKTNIQNVIGQGLADAAAAGRDCAAQTEEGVRAARQICSDMTVSEALNTVEPGEAVVISDLDIYRSATALMNEHGGDAP